jgi:lipoprotein-anchoring transpeptidase ErfK/SrfK
MIDRRHLMLGGLALLLAPANAEAQRKKKKAVPFKVDAKYVPQQVPFYGFLPGVIFVDRENHFLYFVESATTARRYGIGVGRAGLTLTGKAVVGRKAEWPSWRPTNNMIRVFPQKYKRYAGGMPGGPRNPLGARALYIYRDGKDTLFRIHGTTEPSSIGRSVSNGCIRMINDHVIDLYARVPVGAEVIIV